MMSRVITLMFYQTALGSSPHVWGQVPFFAIVKHIFRIIPTRVGTRFVKVIVGVQATDHPHACGDKVLKSTVVSKVQGSSPRVWGQEFLNIWASSM